ncbi:MAG: hypothetical protein AAFQ95_23975 [Cyanobacteria bacterium J06621_3]
MLAFRVVVNGQIQCTVGSDSVANVIAGLQGEKTGGAEPPRFDVAGMTDASTHVYWHQQTLAVGDTIQIEVVDVPASSISAPIKIRTDIPDMVEREKRAYYERLKAQYEPS